MLRGIRKASANWLGRAVMGVVMGLLAASFAVWGINDIFRGFGRSTVAKIGSTEIGVEQFRRDYNERLQQLARQVGHPLTPEQASALGLDRQVLGDMVAQAGLDQRAQKMRLAVSDADIVQRLTADPALRTPTGQLDRLRFAELLRNAGYSEQRFIAEQRRAMLRRQIIEFVLRQPAGAEGMARSHQSISEPTAQHRLRGPRPGAGGRYSATDRR